MDKGSHTARHPVVVYYEDTDFSGFVYHANYLKFFERAREHALGISYLKQLFTAGIHFVVAEANIVFKAPGRHGDRLTVVSRMEWGRGCTVMFHQEAWRDPLDGAPALLLCTATVRLATLNGENRPIRLPSFVFDHFQGLADGTVASD